MYKLFLDTTTKFLCVGISQDDTILYQHQELAEKKQSEMAIPYIDLALKEAKIKLKDIGEVVVTIGPGSFTGIRIGMCIAKVLATFHNIPLKAISSLNAYAYQPKSIVILDAKAQRGYVGIYQNHQCIVKDCVLEIEKIQQLIKQYEDYSVVLDGHLVGCTDDFPPNVIQNMLQIEKITLPIEDVDKLIPMYLKETIE